MEDNVKIIKDIFFLYELSLAVGNSLDIQENCRHFLNTLVSRKGLSFASVWLCPEEKDTLELLYAIPRHRVAQESVSKDHFIVQRLRQEPFFTLGDQHPDFGKVVQEKNNDEGVYGVFCLGDIGFLKIHTLTQHEPFSAKEMSQLNSVLQKFTVSLEGCLAHKKLQQESQKRRMAQEALQKSNARYADLFQNMNDVLMLLDKEGNIVDANQAAEQLTGIPLPELLHSSLKEIIHPEDWERSKVHFQQLPKAGSLSGFELRIISRTGEAKYVQVNSSAIYDQGEFVGSRDIVRDVTTQKEAEKKLLDSEYRLRQIIDTSLDAVITIDGEGRVTEWNLQAEKIFGYQREEVMSRLLSELIIPHQHRQSHHDGMQQFHRTGKGPVLNNRIEITALNRDGWEFPIELSVTPIKYGDEFFFSAFVRDISVRKQAQVELLNSQTRLVSLIKNLQTGILLEDENRKIVLANQTFCTLFGIPAPPDALIGQDCSNAAEETKGLFKNPGAFVVEIEQLLRRRKLQAGDELEMVNGRILVRDYVPIYTGEKYLGHLWQYRDVTERRRAQKIIQKSEEKYRSIMENLELGMMEVDQEDHIVKAYDRFCAMTGYQEEELLGKNASDIFLPPASQLIMEQQAKERKTGKAGAYEIQIRKKNGELIWVLISGAPILDEQGELQGSLGIHYDITNRKKLERDLSEAKHIAEHARKAEQQFLANMSHEIRTPMNSVIGMTYLLYETPINERQKEYLDALRFSADSLLGIINNILDLSKIEAGELELEERAFNLLQLTNSLFRTFQFKLREKPISMVLNFDPSIENMVIGDPTRLNQILTNLLGNASKFTNEGTIGLDVKLLSQNAEEYIVEFIVHDTGIGIPKDKIKLIFENFKQADLEVVRKFGGTGLGLTIVKQLVEMQNGQITVSSQPEKGAKFKFTMPLKNSGIAAREKPKTEEKLNANLQHLLKNIKVLVVEDNSMNQKLISRMLETWGCEFQMAEDGYQALGKAALAVYDIILMDIHMPGIDGCEVTRQIRQNINNPNVNTPIIALTAAALLDEKKRALQAGMDDFLTKPFSPRSLQSKIIQLLKLVPPEDPETASQKKVQKEERIVIDLTYLYEFSNNDIFFVKDIIESFLAETPSALKQLTISLNENDWEKLYRTAHSLKSNLMMLGMKEQEQYAQTIESSIKNGAINKSDLSGLIDQLIYDVQSAFVLLREKLNTL